MLRVLVFVEFYYCVFLYFLFITLFWYTAFILTTVCSVRLEV
jgi:hypothetical protein